MDERVTLSSADQSQSAHTFKAIVESSQDVLYAARSVFPFDLFPDNVTVDRTQVTITHRRFFFMGDVISVRIEDIISIAAYAGPFFGSVQISTRFNPSDRLYRISWLERSQALRLKAIIQGLIVMTSKQVDLTHLSKELLVIELIRLGESAVSEAP